MVVCVEFARARTRPFAKIDQFRAHSDTEYSICVHEQRVRSANKLSIVVRNSGQFVHCAMIPEANTQHNGRCKHTQSVCSHRDLKDSDESSQCNPTTTWELVCRLLALSEWLWVSKWELFAANPIGCLLASKSDRPVISAQRWLSKFSSCSWVAWCRLAKCKFLGCLLVFLLELAFSHLWVVWRRTLPYYAIILSIKWIHYKLKHTANNHRKTTSVSATTTTSKALEHKPIRN